MAFFVPAASGDFATAATWNKSPTADASSLDNTSTTAFSATPRISPVFTAPDLVSNCIGGIFYMAPNIGWTGSVTLKLQEFDGVSTWVDKATEVVAYSALRYAAHDMTAVYIKFTTPYTWATLTAGYYRFSLTISSTGASGSMAAISNVPGMIAVDDRTGAPGSTDDVIIVGEARAGADVVITATGTVTWGGDLRGSNPSTTSNTNSFRFAATLGLNGELKFDHTSTNTITVNGQIYIADKSTFTCGTDANPITMANPTTISISDCLCHRRGTLSIIGVDRGTRRIWSSGTGTAASPLVITAAAGNWAVNDQLVVTEVGTSATNYNGCQYRYIITVNSSTSFVGSSTLGGSENALTNTRSYAGGNSHVINLTRSILIKNNSSNPAIIFGGNESLINLGQTLSFKVKHVRFEACATFELSGKGSGTGGINAGGPFIYEFEDIVIYGLTSTVITLRTNGMRATERFSWNDITIVASTAQVLTTLGGGFFDIDNVNIIDMNRGGVSLSGCPLSTFDDWVIASQNKDGSTSASGNMISFGSGNNVLSYFKNFDIYSNRQTPVTTGITCEKAPDFFECNFGVRGTLQSATNIYTGSGPPTFFTNCLFGAQYTTKAVLPSIQSSCGVVNFNQTANENLYLGIDGNYKLELSGAGLADTTTRTVGSKALKVYGSSNSSIGGYVFYSFYVLAEAGKAVSLFGYAKKAAAMVGQVVKMRITLPFEETYSQEITLTDDTNWNLFSLSADYSAGTVTSVARIDLIMPYVASGIIYFDDLYNGTNSLTAYDMVHQAQPAAIMSNTIGDPNAVWQVLRSSAVVSGTFGEALQSITPAQGAPGVLPPLGEMLSWLYKAWRNKTQQTATEYKLYDDAGTTVDHKATVSDNGTTFERSEIASGP